MDRIDSDEGAEPAIEDLLRRVRAGDQAAVEALFKHIQPKLDAWAARHLGARTGVARRSDVVQETALRAFRKLDTFNGSTAGELFTWLRVIFRRRAAQMLRDARRKKREDGDVLSMDSPEASAAPAPQKSPSQTASSQEDYTLLLGNIHSLPDDQRNAIWLCHLKELPVAEVAETMGKSEAAVAGLLQRGLRTLRAKMAPGGGPAASEGSASLPASLNEAVAALLIYLKRRDAGETVDAAAFAAEHPSCAGEVSDMLQWIERIQAIKPAAAGR